MNNTLKISLCLVVVGVAAFATFLLTRSERTEVKPSIQSNAIGAMQLPTKEAEKALTKLIEKNVASPDKKVQDQVTSTRIKLGYKVAERKDFVAARKVFKEAVTEHKGSQNSSSDYGSLQDQAAYQAIVCLEASGDKTGALKEYREFVTTRKASPLIQACRRRIERLNGGELSANDEAILTSAVQYQNERVQKELVRCGPKALAHLFAIHEVSATPLDDLTKECKTNEQGTTVEGMLGALHRRGFETTARELNSSDFRKVKLPAIWLNAQHYVVLEKIDKTHMTLYDPLRSETRTLALPRITDHLFRAVVIEAERDPSVSVNLDSTTEKTHAN